MSKRKAVPQPEERPVKRNGTQRKRDKIPERKPQKGTHEEQRERLSAVLRKANREWEKNNGSV